MKKNFFTWTLIFLLTLMGRAYGQNAMTADTTRQSKSTFDDMSLEDLLNVELTSSSKIQQRAIESPSVISLITNQQISEFGYTSVNDILYKQPGFTPSQDYDRQTVSSRGIFEGWNNNHLLFLIDGIPVNDNLYGSAYTWDITSLIFTKNIEILRGPGSALYGSSAMNGVIQINTLSPADLNGSSRTELKLGDYGKRIYNFITGNDFKHFSMMAAFSHSQSDGNEYYSYDGSAEVDGAGNPLKFLTKDHQKSDYFWTKIQGKNSLSDVSFQYHFQQWNFQTGHGWVWFISDLNESMKDTRHLFSLRYAPQINDRLSTDFLVRYQIHEIDWNDRFYRNNAYGGFYPAGMWEYLNTETQDIFARAQAVYTLPNHASILAGIESDLFFYNGDNEHYSNVDVDNTFAPFDASNSFKELGPVFEYIKGNPVKNLGFYTQVVSGNLLGDQLTATIGARYDVEMFDYKQIHAEGTPLKSKSFSQFNPRLALVYMVQDNLSFKAMWGKAFRAPVPSELFAAHSYFFASNVDGLQPEIVNTAEFAIDWIINKNLNWRTNFFYTGFDNLIAYSTQNNNLSTNLFSLTNTGIEAELLFGYDAFNGFLNVSYTKRVNESIQDTTIAKSDNLTWDAPVKVNCGVSYSMSNLKASLTGHYQAAVSRRASEKGIQIVPLSGGVAFNMDNYRGAEVDPWWTADLNVSYKLAEYVQVGATVKNIFDQKYYLVKKDAFPFDYKQPGRRYTVNIVMDL